MNKLMKLWMTNALSLWILDGLLSSMSFASGISLILTALIVSVLNETIKPVLQLLSLPITFLTLGLFSLVVNGIVIRLAFALSSGSYIASLGSAIWVSILLAIINSLITKATE